MKHPQPLTPAALYARVSSAGRTCTCPRQPNSGPSRTTNGYAVARDYVDEAKKGASPTGPSVGRQRGLLPRDRQLI